MHRNDLPLKSLVNLEDWQNVQDSFSDVLEVSLRTFDLEGRLISKVSRPCRLWTKIPRNNPRYSQFCGNCVLRKPTPKKIGVKEATNLKCPFGLEIILVPITALSKRIAAYIAIGPLIPNKRKDKSEYIKYTRRLKVDVEDLMDALIEINVFSYNRIRSMTRLVTDIFSYMAQTGYHKKRLGEIAPEIIGVDPLFSRYYEEKFLNAFLKTCTLALDADSGSVMTLD